MASSTISAFVPNLFPSRLSISLSQSTSACETLCTLNLFNWVGFIRNRVDEARRLPSGLPAIMMGG